MPDDGRVLLPLYGQLPQRRTPAWVVSVVLHGAALGLLLWCMQRADFTPPSEPARMIFIEPVPAPPPPPGGSLNATAVSAVPEPVRERPKEVPRPQRLAAPRNKVKVMPTPAQEPIARPSGLPEGSPGGVVGGAVGGEAGGKVGGIVGGHGDAPVSADRIEHPPVVIARVLPDYPPSARARGLQGRVVLRAVVDRQGRVEEAITVVESSPMFDAAAIAALRRWRFEPGRESDGQAVRVLIDVPIRFQLR